MTETKIIKLKDCSSNDLRNLVLCHGHFNVIHPGHIRYLKHAKEMGESLAVSIVGNKEFKKSNRDHHFDEVERAEGVASIKFVDRVVLLENECLKSAIKILKPKVLVLGKEFEFQNFDLIRESAEMVVQMGGKIHFHAGETHYASTQYLLKSESELESESLAAFRKTTDLLGIKPDRIRQTLENFSNASILVIGDSIIDQYVACDALGMSAEAPVVVARELESKRYLGGAGIVSNHAKRLGAKCRFLSVVGDDDLKDFVSDELQRQGVEIAIASDYNSGSCNIQSMPFIITLSCIYLKMNILEAIQASTIIPSKSLSIPLVIESPSGSTDTKSKYNTQSPNSIMFAKCLSPISDADSARDCLCSSNV